MELRHWIAIALIALGAGVGSLAGGAAHAAPLQQTRLTSVLTRYMLISSRYTTMHVEVDGQRVFSQPVNTLSSYVATPAGRPVTVAITASGGNSESSALIQETRSTFNPHTGIQILRDDGAYAATVDPDAPTAGQGQVWVDFTFAATRPIIRLAGRTLTTEGEMGTSVQANVAPGIALLEARSDDGFVLASRYVRVQPGYQYMAVLFSVGSGEGASHQIVVHATSPNLRRTPSETQSFALTGHMLEGRFGEYWDATGGLPVFGYPLNDDRLAVTPEGAWISQVFERNRFEYHPSNAAPYDVLLGRLGDERLRQLQRDWRDEFRPRPVATGCEGVTVDGREFAVCDPFRTYYHNHGLEFDGQPGFSPAESLALFGLPLTQAAAETNSSGDRVVTQWFERARLEYHPNNTPRQQVLLGRLGAEVYDLAPLTFDDEDRAFERTITRAEAPDWKEARGGIGGHFWYTCAAQQNPGRGGPDDLEAHWSTPALRGRFEVQAYIPTTHATIRDAFYELTSGETTIGARVDQRANEGRWVTLEVMDLDAALTVRVFSITDGGATCDEVAADAVRLIPR